MVQDSEYENHLQANKKSWHEYKPKPTTRKSLIKKQKQPTRGVLRKRCSENMHEIYRRTPMPSCNFNKGPKQLY